MTLLAAYDRARVALAEATRVDEVLSIRAEIEHVKLYAKQIRDRRLLAEATTIQARAERRLGELLLEAEKCGWIGRGRPKKDVAADLAPPLRFTLQEAGIDRNLSARVQKLAKLPEDEFETGLAAVSEKVLSGAATLVNGARAIMESKKERRAERERELGSRQCALPDKRYGVIYADPEWRFEPFSRDTGLDRAADNHYPTSPTDDICARPVADIAADDCVLFLWATVPMLPDALSVMGAWGFGYRSHFIWAKDRIGTGYWARNKHELLLIGTRGSVPAPAMGTQFDSLIPAPVTAHSEKPQQFYEIIEAYFPHLPKIELNARRARAGWDRWGNEAPKGDEAA